MAQDFAKQRPPQQQARKTSKARPSRSAHWNWFFSGIFVGAVLAVGGYFGFLRWQASQPAAQETIGGTQTPQELPAFEFDFYRELATADVPVSVPVDDAAVPAAGAPAAVAAATTQAGPAAAAEPVVNFLLQAGSFQDRQEAEERRAKITLLNMSAEIVPGVVAGRTWYRVQVGPFGGRNAAEEARKQLSANNIDSLPLLMR